MKKVIVSILISMILFNNVAFGAINTQVEINDENINLIGTSTYVEEPVTISVYDANRKYYINQSKTDDAGNFEFGFQLDDNKVYESKIKIKDEEKIGAISTEEISVQPTIDITKEINDKNIKIMGTSNLVGKPVTIQVYDDSRKYYINQDTVDISGNFQFIFNLDFYQTYEVKVKLEELEENFKITLVEAEHQFVIRVESINGTVNKSPAKAKYEYGEKVTLTATPAAGYEFVNWSGDASGTNPSVIITVDGNMKVVANYKKIENHYSLDVTSYYGTVNKNPAKSSYEYGEKVTLTAIPAAGYEFVNWSGDASGTNPSVIITVDGNMKVVANYKKIENHYSLDVTSYYGTVNKSPAKAKYEYGEKVTLTATPAAGYEFVNWSGDASGTNPSVIITVDGNMKVVANYKKIENHSNNNHSSNSNNHTNNTGTIIRSRVEISKDVKGNNIAKVVIDKGSIEQALKLINKTQGNAEEKLIEIVAQAQTASKVSFVLTEDIIKLLSGSGVNFKFNTNGIVYKIPAEELTINSMLKDIDTENIYDIEVSIDIKTPDQSVVFELNNDIEKKGYKMVVNPVSFQIKTIYTDKDGKKKEVLVDRFNQYVERMIKIPEGINPSDITTAVVYNEDKTFSHVPTKIKEIDGVYYAIISSLTNSIYTVISNNVEFEDMNGHWAQISVNNMASRLIINGYSDGKFKPNNEITRAEFMQLIVNALGLNRHETDEASMSFIDVNKGEWYYNALKIAKDRNIVNGYSDLTFKPDNKITREEAYVLLVNAMKISKDVKLEYGSNVLVAYKDSTNISNWALESIAYLVKKDIVNGYDNKLNPKGNITRAETAAIIYRMIKEMGMIN